jgi:hypothetical protein
MLYAASAVFCRYALRFDFQSARMRLIDICIC